MKKNDKKEMAFLALTDLYYEFNSSVNHLLILREFLRDVLSIKDGKEIGYDFPSIFKYKNKS